MKRKYDDNEYVDKIWNISFHRNLFVIYNEYSNANATSTNSENEEGKRKSVSVRGTWIQVLASIVCTRNEQQRDEQLENEIALNRIVFQTPEETNLSRNTGQRNRNDISSSTFRACQCLPLLYMNKVVNYAKHESMKKPGGWSWELEVEITSEVEKNRPGKRTLCFWEMGGGERERERI